MAEGTSSTEPPMSEMPMSEIGEASPALTTTGFPPYPPYVTEPAPPSVAETIFVGRDLRLQHKSTPRKPVRPPPKPARPRGPKATDVKMSKRAMRAHARCLRRHGAVLTDRLERISKPQRRHIIHMWREHADTLPAETIARLRGMLDADEPFKPDQAYEYFVNLKKTKKKAAKMQVKQIKKDVLAVCGDRRFAWARNATVALARGIQERLSKPGCYSLADGMLRLSNIVLEDLCGFMHARTPSRRCTHPKAKFMMEMSDKIAVWMDEVINESEDRMLMMDCDEDDEVNRSANQGDEEDGADTGTSSTQTAAGASGETPSVTPGETAAATPTTTPGQTPRTSKSITGIDDIDDAGFTDDFLNMMAGGGILKGPQPAYLKFTGEMKDAFNILTDSMYKKGNENLITHGKFRQNYTDAADELIQTTDFNATEFNTSLANKLNEDLMATAKPSSPSNIMPYMKEMVDICSNQLAQNAEFNKDKGPAFKLLVKTMRRKPNDQLYERKKVRRTYARAATELEDAKSLETDHDDPNLSQEIHSKLSKLVDNITPKELKDDMAETLDATSKYLSQYAVDENERGPAFDRLINELEKRGEDTFTPQFDSVNSNFAAAYVLKSAPGLSNITPDPKTAPVFETALHDVVDVVTPKHLQNDMNQVIQSCANYLSAFVRDRDKALQTLLKVMKSNPSKELAKRNDYTMTYGAGAAEAETAPVIVPFMPVKDIADEAKDKLEKDVASSTPSELKSAMKSMVQDVARYLSQGVALRSGVAGKRFPLNFLAAVKKSLGQRPLFKYKAYGQTYSDGAEELKYAGPLEKDSKNKNLESEISSELQRGVPTRLPTTLVSDLDNTIADASKHLAKVGSEKGEALQHLVDVMKEEGEAPLEKLQGYQQTYNDGARRIENATSLSNDRVDKRAYESVSKKLNALVEKKPSPDHAKQMPGIVDESAKFLSSPLPESDLEKRQILADLMARKGDEILDQEGLYKLTYTEGGKEILNAPVDVVTAKDKEKKKELEEKITSTIPDKKLQDVLKETAKEGSAYLSDVIKGRAEVMQVMHDEMKKADSKVFLNVGNFKKNHGEAAELLETAPHFGGQHPSPALVDKVANTVRKLSTLAVSESEKPYIKDTAGITSDYIAGVATAGSGLDEKTLAALRDEEEARKTRQRAGVGSPVGAEQKSEKPTGTGTRTAGEKSGGATASGLDGKALATSDGRAAIKTSTTSDPSGSRRTSHYGQQTRAGSPERGEQKGQKSSETGKERRAREDASERTQRQEEEAGTRTMEDKQRGSKTSGGRASPAGAETDVEREQATQLMLKALRARGNEVFYKQPHNELTHTQASELLSMKPPMKLDKSVKESGDTTRLHKKFERKLSSLVSNITPADMRDVMEDVVIESARKLSECFVSKSYQTLVQEALISEMQKRGNEILADVNGDTETFFFAAQRLKKAKSLDVKEPCDRMSYNLMKKLEDTISHRSMPRKLTNAMKNHTKEAADYLSEVVTKPDEYIEAYVSLLNEMESAGDNPLIEGNIPKSYKEAAAYLRQLTSFEDQIRRPDTALQASVKEKLKDLMANIPEPDYSKAALDSVISDSTKLLVSYIMLQGEKTEALKILVKRMEDHDGNVLLRHGNIRKTNADGAKILKPKNTDQLAVTNADPVVARKIEIKLFNLMNRYPPEKHQALFADVIEDVTMYLAVTFLQPQVIQVCKCMKNVFVQCELWCDEILRRVARPCCTCSRHVSAQALSDLAPADEFVITTGSSRVSAPGVEMSLTQCPSRAWRPRPCPASKPASECNNPTTSYLLYSTRSSRHPSYIPTKLSSTTQPDAFKIAPLSSQRTISKSQSFSTSQSLLSKKVYSENVQYVQEDENISSPQGLFDPDMSSTSCNTPETMTSGLYPQSDAKHPFRQSPTTMFVNIDPPPENVPSHSTSTYTARRSVQTRRGYSSHAPIVTTDQMADWHAMMVSLMWNVQAWRDWIQENIDSALAYEPQSDSNSEEEHENWAEFQRRVETEALQWRQYNIFSRQLTLRLAMRYRDKEIVSPTRATIKTAVYTECQQEMIDIIDMFNRWTKWLNAIVKEADALQRKDSSIPVYNLRWRHLKMKVQEYLEDWIKYNKHLNTCKEQKYQTFIAEWVPTWRSSSGPVWVVSACGAVPSGAVAAGLCDGEVTWVARTTHRCNVLPATLHPSKHCCILFADGEVHHYTKYQVMCNADVSWVAWRAGEVGARAVRVAQGVYVGRVQWRGAHVLGAVRAPLYRCYVLLCGRPLAFSCYELLVLNASDES